MNKIYYIYLLLIFWLLAIAVQFMVSDLGRMLFELKHISGAYI